MIPFQKILVAFSSEAKDRTTLELALRLAGQSGGSLTIAHVIPPLPEDLPVDIGGEGDLREMLAHAAGERLQAMAESLPETGVPVETLVLTGHPAMEIVREVLRNGHDLLIKASGTKRRISEHLLGSVDMRLLRKCPCPVWIVKPGGHKELKTVLATIDPTSPDEVEQELNHSMIKLGHQLAEVNGAELHVLHAWSAWGENRLRGRMRSVDFGEYVLALRSRAAKAFSGFLQPHSSLVPPQHRHLLEGNPEDVVPDFVRERDVDLVVMGTVARMGIPGFLIGNTAEMILGRVGCSILAVKPEGFVTPVEL